MADTAELPSRRAGTTVRRRPVLLSTPQGEQRLPARRLAPACSQPAGPGVPARRRPTRGGGVAVLWTVAVLLLTPLILLAGLVALTGTAVLGASRQLRASRRLRIGAPGASHSHLSTVRRDSSPADVAFSHAA